jgi:pimeloyl-ACP methyl ester carboxylesterase
LNDFFVTWAKVQPEIANSTRVCSYDRADLGWSQPSPNPHTTEVMAEELHTRLRNTGIEGPYILVGHSFGEIILLDFFQQYPDQVLRMILVDSAHEQQMDRLPLPERVCRKAYWSISHMILFELIRPVGALAFDHPPSWFS